jgi:signal transduction histidine kinase
MHRAMSFLDELREHLRAVEQGATTTAPSVDVDLAAVRAHFLATLRRLEDSGERPAHALELLYLRSRGLWFERFVACAERELRKGLCFGTDVAILQRHVCEVVDDMCLRDRDVPIAPNTPIRTRELVHISWEAERFADPGPILYDMEQYAFENRLVRGAGARTTVSSLGRVLLDLPAVDAVRWLLTLELHQSISTGDPLHRHSSVLSALLKEPSETFFRKGSHGRKTWPFNTMMFQRLCALGVIDSWEDRSSWGYDLVATYRETLEDLVAGRRTPLSLLAESLLAEERNSLAGHAPTLPSPEFAAELQARHASMVVHEIRNTIVPMKMALSGLFRTLEESAPDVRWRSQRERVESGVARFLRYAGDLEQIIRIGAPTLQPFDLVAAVHDAIKGLNGSLGLAVIFEPNAGLPQLIGHRAHFTLVITNLLRNAAQNNPKPGPVVKLAASLKAARDAVVVSIEDNGPGVPELHREEIFRRGFALRPGGSGLGLALVREVVEREMRGAVRCESSELGGARFVLSFPIAPKENS